MVCQWFPPESKSQVRGSGHQRRGVEPCYTAESEEFLNKLRKQMSRAIVCCVAMLATLLLADARETDTGN